MNAATGAGLREFLEWVVKRGEVNPSTGNAQRVAATKVLASDDDPDGVDVRSIDVEQLLTRFENLNREHYSSASMATYKTRFRKAVSMYLAWLDGDPTWKNVLRTRRRSGLVALRKSSFSETSDVEAAEQTASATDANQFSYARRATSPTVTYQMPLRPDLLVEIQLPVDLTVSDADRVAAFVRSLAFDFPRQEQSGGDDEEAR